MSQLDDFAVSLSLHPPNEAPMSFSAFSSSNVDSTRHVSRAQAERIRQQRERSTPAWIAREAQRAKEQKAFEEREARQAFDRAQRGIQSMSLRGHDGSS